MNSLNTLKLESNRQWKINFDGSNLSSDARLLLIKEFSSRSGFERLVRETFKTNNTAQCFVYILIFRT